MKKIVASALTAVTLLSATTAFAGGPVVIVDEPEVIAEKPRSGMLLPLILGGIILCVALCGNDEEDGGDR